MLKQWHTNEDRGKNKLVGQKTKFRGKENSFFFLKLGHLSFSALGHENYRFFELWCPGMRVQVQWPPRFSGLGLVLRVTPSASLVVRLSDLDWAMLLASLILQLADRWPIVGFLSLHNHILLTFYINDGSIIIYNTSR